MNDQYTWKGAFDEDDLNRLHAEAFEHEFIPIAWTTQLADHSLGWVCARRGDRLIGFVNVAWDGGVHAFILDTIVAADLRHHGIGTRLVEEATRHAREAGCEWLHVDFDDHLRDFYFTSCEFVPTNAGLIQL